MRIKWTKVLQNFLDQMMKNLQKTREVINVKVSNYKEVCKTGVRPENIKV